MTQEQLLEELAYLNRVDLETVYPMREHEDGTYAIVPGWIRDGHETRYRLTYEDDEFSQLVFVYVLDGKDKIYIGYYGYDYLGRRGGFTVTSWQPT
jgi:hypothetical protein